MQLNGSFCPAMLITSTQVVDASVNDTTNSPSQDKGYPNRLSYFTFLESAKSR